MPWKFVVTGTLTFWYFFSVQILVFFNEILGIFISNLIFGYNIRKKNLTFFFEDIFSLFSIFCIACSWLGRLWKFMSENQEVFVGSTEQGLAKVNKCSYIHFYCNKPKTNIFEKKTVIWFKSVVYLMRKAMALVDHQVVL